MAKRKPVRLYRAWINQPSTLQPLHKYHGKVCIAYDNHTDDLTVYFTSGPIHSMTVLRECVSQIPLSSAE